MESIIIIFLQLSFNLHHLFSASLLLLLFGPVCFFFFFSFTSLFLSPSSSFLLLVRSSLSLPLVPRLARPRCPAVLLPFSPLFFPFVSAFFPNPVSFLNSRHLILDFLLPLRLLSSFFPSCISTAVSLLILLLHSSSVGFLRPLILPPVRSTCRRASPQCKSTFSYNLDLPYWIITIPDLSSPLSPRLSSLTEPRVGVDHCGPHYIIITHHRNGSPPSQHRRESSPEEGGGRGR